MEEKNVVKKIEESEERIMKRLDEIHSFIVAKFTGDLNREDL